MGTTWNELVSSLCSPELSGTVKNLHNQIDAGAERIIEDIDYDAPDMCNCIDFKNDGLELCFENGILSHLFLSMNEFEDFSPFNGCILGEIDKEWTMGQIKSYLGHESASGPASEHRTMGYSGPWIKYEFDDYYVHFQFLKDGRLKQVTLSASKSAVNASLRIHNAGIQAHHNGALRVYAQYPLWLSGYPELISKKLTPFAENAFGVQFLVDANNLISVFHPGGDELVDLAIEREQFLSLLDSDYSELLQLDLYSEACEKLGEPNLSEHFGLITGLAEGGDLSTENMLIIDAFHHMKLLYATTLQNRAEHSSYEKSNLN